MVYLRPWTTWRAAQRRTCDRRSRVEPTDDSFLGTGLRFVGCEKVGLWRSGGSGARSHARLGEAHRQFECWSDYTSRIFLIFLLPCEVGDGSSRRCCSLPFFPDSSLDPTAHQGTLSAVRGGRLPSPSRADSSDPPVTGQGMGPLTFMGARLWGRADWPLVLKSRALART